MHHQCWWLYGEVILYIYIYIYIYIIWKHYLPNHVIVLLVCFNFCGTKKEALFLEHPLYKRPILGLFEDLLFFYLFVFLNAGKFCLSLSPLMSSVSSDVKLSCGLPWFGTWAQITLYRSWDLIANFILPLFLRTGHKLWFFMTSKNLASKELETSELNFFFPWHEFVAFLIFSFLLISNPLLKYL